MPPSDFPAAQARPRSRGRAVTNAILAVVALALAGRTLMPLWDRQMSKVTPHVRVDDFRLAMFSAPDTLSYPDLQVLDDFETQNDFYNMLVIEGPIKAARSSAWSSRGSNSVEVAFNGDHYSEVAINYTPPWWLQYDSLSFDANLAEGKIRSVSFRVGDLYTATGYCARCQKFRKALTLTPGVNHFSFSVREMADSVDLTSHFKSLHIGFKPLGQGRLYLDNFRLTKNAR